MQVTNLAADAEEFTSNAFIVDGRALIDAGADPLILEQLNGVELETVVVTHSHHDHVENLPDIVEAYGPVVYAFNPDNVPVAAERVTDGDTITVAGHSFTVLHTPGHKNDHICLYNEAEGVLFSGDLIFPGGSFGRTDLEEGDRDVLIDSIERIAARDVQELYAGHDAPTTDNVNAQIQESLEEAKKREPKY